MLQHVAETISRYNMFDRGQTVGVAVSGGADSLCLLYVLRELAPRWELRLCLIHLNHRLRGAESDADAAWAGELAAQLGLPIHQRDADILAAGGNLEQEGRRARQEFFTQLTREGAVGRVALGHTMSDQAETVLFRLLRGCGAAGLSGIRPVTASGIVRPLLGVTRAQVREYLKEQGLTWREDSSNADLRFARNRIRHHLLPLLEREWNPALAQTLSHMATVARDEEDYWNGEVDKLVEQAGGLSELSAKWLAGLKPALARRLIRRAIEAARGDLRGIDFHHTEQVLQLAAGREGRGRVEIPGLEAVRSFDRLRLAPPGEDSGFRLCPQIPGCYPVPGGKIAIRLDLEPATSGYNREDGTKGSALDWECISGELELRSWQPGDRYRPAGHAHETTLKSLFQRAKIPAWSRRNWPVLVAGARIVWAAKFGPAADCAATPASRTVLRVGVGAVSV